MSNPKFASYWQAILKPLLRDHWDWYERGRVGGGRIVMSDEDVRGANVRGLEGARFDRTNFSGAVINLMSDVELYSCTFDEALVQSSSWHRAVIQDCRFRGATVFLSDFTDARIEGGDWLGAWLERSTWTGAHVSNVSFVASNFVDSRFDDATFIDCDFSRVDLSRVELAGDLARCPGTRFIRCNFHGANIQGLRLNNTTFDHCRFEGVRGKPDLEGACNLVEPEFASGALRGRRDAADVLRVWRERDADYLRHWYVFGNDTHYQPADNYPERKK